MAVLRSVAVLLALSLTAAVGQPRPADAATVPAAVCTTGVPGDINGDGYAEVAVGETGYRDDQGRVHVLYGDRSGLTATRRSATPGDQVFSQGDAGVPSGASHAEFGDTTVLGDFNGDGCADLAVAALNEDDVAGSVTVLYGGPDGLSTREAQRLTVGSVFGLTKDDRCKKVYELDDYFYWDCEQFGQTLAVGDLDGDGRDDLVAAAPRLRTGAVAVFPGGDSGIEPSRATLLRAADLGLASTDGMTSMTVANVDGTGADEIVIGAAPDSVLVVSGSGVGLLPTTIRRFTPSSPGIRGRGDNGFGASVASGDVNGDGRDDVAVSSADDDAVTLLLGSSSGLTGRGSQRWTSASPGVEATAARAFGAAMAFGDLDGDGRADLVIGAPGDEVGHRSNAGSVTVLRGSAEGLTTAGFGGRTFTQSTPGIPGKADRNKRFGNQLTTASVRGVRRSTILVGRPNERRGGHDYSGVLYEFGGSAHGPTAHGSTAWDMASPGVRGRLAPYTEFGTLTTAVIE